MNWGSEYQRAVELCKAKYTKRTGGPGNYKYEYANSGATHGNEDRALDGMEGPFTFPSGRELYYDNSYDGGTYYDRGQDRYLTRDEAESATSTNPHADQEKREKAQYHAEMQSQAANKDKRDKAQLEKLKSSTDTSPSEGTKFDTDGGLTDGTMSRFEGKFNGFTAADHEASSNAHFKEMRGASDRGDFKKLEGHSQMVALHDAASKRADARKSQGNNSMQSEYERAVALNKSKYTKRTGGPGNYKYEYGDSGGGSAGGGGANLSPKMQAMADDIAMYYAPSTPKAKVEQMVADHGSAAAGIEDKHDAAIAILVSAGVRKKPSGNTTTPMLPNDPGYAGSEQEHLDLVYSSKSMKSIFDGWLSKGFGGDADTMDDGVEEEVEEEEEEVDEAEKGALGAGYSSGMSQGAGYASAPGGGGAAAVHSAPGAVSTIAGAGASKPAPSAAPASSAPSAAPKNTTGSSGGAPAGGGVGKSFDKDDYMTHGSGSCSACQSGNCPHGVKKAITSRSMAIPFYLRAGIQGYDPDGIRRSATAQNSAQYTSLAPQVRESMEVQENISAMRASNEATTKCFAHGVTYKSQNCPLCTTAKSLGTVRQDMRFGNR